MSTSPSLELLALERRGWDALCRGEGADFYGDLMTDGGLMVLVDGSVLDRQQVVASLRDAPPWDHYTLDDVRTVPIGGDAVALVYRATAERQDAPPFRALMSSTYVVVDGRARLALYQQTALAPR